MVREGMVDLIRREGLRPGDQILSQNQLAHAFSVNPLTVIRALAELCEENILYRENGRGTFVGPAMSKKKIRKIGLALPGEDLNSPENNPECWPNVQQWFKSFMECMGDNRIFGAVTIPCHDVSKETFDKVGEFDLTFFLYPNGYEKLITSMLDKNISCPVLIDEPREGLNCLCLPFDRLASVRIGISHLLGLNYRRIAFLCTEDRWFDSGIDAYRETMSCVGITIGSDWVIRGSGDFKEALEFLTQHNRFDAVFTANTKIALLALDHFQRNGVSVPDDLGVMSDEGLDFIVTRPPYLSSVMYPHKQIINFALSFLEAHHYKYKKAYRQAFFGELFKGKTCRGNQSSEVKQ